MEKTWANSLDLHLDVSGTRVRAKLESALREAVRSGRLAPGTRLPSSRALAADLGVARNTVAEVFTQLTAEGWLTARTGSGTTVAQRRGTRPARQPPPGTAPAVPRYDLRPGEPNVAAFPRRPWLAAMRKALETAPDSALSYPDPRGLPVLRAALAGYLARARGVIIEPDGANLLVCSGFVQGLELVCRVLRETGVRTLAIEQYGHQIHRQAVARQGLRLRDLPLDDDGAVIAGAGGAGAALLTPAHQFPLGMTLAPHRRREAAGWNGLVIEDDYDGEFRFDRQPAGAVQALAPDSVIYCGTASKSMAPGMRIAWLVMPPRLLEPVTDLLSHGPSTLDQLALAEFITSGEYDRQIRRARTAYRRRRDRLVAAIAPLGLRVSGIAAGLHVVIDLPSAEAEELAIHHARSHGLALESLGEYASGDRCDGKAGLVVAYARPPEHAYTTALARLCAVLSRL
jgi:GntR family transcriptional regulator/MocR family aminotransferase